MDAKPRKRFNGSLIGSMVDSEFDSYDHKNDPIYNRQRSLKTEFELVDNATKKSLIREN